MKSAFLVSKGLLCLYDKQNNTWLFVDMEFLFKCSTRQTCALRSLVSYRAKHSKRNSISMRAHVVLSIYLDAEVPPCPEKGGGVGVKRKWGFQLRTGTDCQNWKCLKLKY